MSRLFLAAAGIALAAAFGCGKRSDAAPMPETQYVFTNQDGQTIRLADLKGKPVLIAFIYTRCPVPVMCPLTSQTMASVQQELKPEDRRKIALVTITFDPTYDTPEVMKTYGKSYHADFSAWQFWSGDPKETEALMARFDAWAKKEGDEYNHNMRGAILDADGTLSRVLEGSQWDIYEVAAHLRKLAK